MKKIVIIGAGGFAREVKFLIEEINKPDEQFEFLGYLVSDLKELNDNDSKEEILGELSWLKSADHPISVAIGIGNPASRLKVAGEIKALAPDTNFPPLIHPNVVYDRSSCIIDEGVIVCASCVLTVNVRLLPFAMLNLCCTVGHEAVIGAGCVLNPTVNISGGVVLEEAVLVGTGAQVLQYIRIGNNATLGAGACATKNLPSDVIAVGIPAKVIKSK